MLNIIYQEESVKLTQIGNLPPRIVKEVYSCGAGEEYIESGVIKLNTEKDSISVQIARTFLEKTGLVKKRNNKLSLTKKGLESVDYSNQMKDSLFVFLLTKFNPAYFDGYNFTHLAGFCMAYSIYLLGIYGTEFRFDSFYADMYIDTIPGLLNYRDDIDDNFDLKFAQDCYSVRTFTRCFHLLGLIDVKIETTDWNRFLLKKTELFDRLFEVTPATSLSCC